MIRNPSNLTNRKVSLFNQVSFLETKLKNNELLKLGKEKTVAIGNGNNDHMMIKNAIIGIAILGKEGLASKTLMNSDLAFFNCIDAIHFLMDEKKVLATLRN